MSSLQARYDVAIVGLGPTGALLAVLLGRLGLRVLALERRAAPHGEPRAVHLDDEAMRILQAAGVAGALRTAPIEGLDVVSARGQLLARAQKAGAAVQPHGYPAAQLFHQPDLEAALRRALAALPAVHVRLGWAVRDVLPDDLGVTLVSAGPSGAFQVRATCVVGCDGARSTVREAMGATLEGSGYSERWLVADARVRVPVRLPERLLQVADPRRPSTFVPLPGDRRRWEFRLLEGELPPEAPPDEASALARALIADHHPTGRIGPDLLRLERAAVYTFRDALASRWVAGRLMLAGDAAHLMPPFLGQGLCAGLRDAHALAWRLALVVRGVSEAALLGSYEAERRAHVAGVARLAVRLGRLMGWRAPAATLRDGLLCLLHRVPPARRRLETLEAGLPAFAPVLRGHAAPATLLPQPSAETDGGRLVRLDDALGPGLALVGLGTAPAGGGEALRDAAAVLGLRRVQVVSGRDPWPAALPGALRVRDREGVLRAWLRAAGHAEGRVLLVRPDRYVLGTYAPGETNRLRADASALLAHREARADGLGRVLGQQASPLPPSPRAIAEESRPEHAPTEHAVIPKGLARGLPRSPS
ncbi:MAG: bifunctional 3-(3-hydroxy-phenyl)propionate/3-hydroxycinnamic acid hydroxylase [Rubricoccaceae bacterium]